MHRAIPFLSVPALGLVALSACGGGGEGKAGDGDTDGDTGGGFLLDCSPSDPMAVPDADAFETEEAEFGPCPVPDADWLECAFVPVPVDYTHVDGRTIELAVARLPASDGEAEKGTLFINPGGPGASGTQFIASARSWDADILAAFDIIGFDPRGTNFSAGVDCTSLVSVDLELDPLPVSDAAREAVLADRFANNEACLAADPELACHMGTANVARDMDVLRRALGEEQITYAGFSYGTRIGSYYANLFPDHLRAALLDAGVMPWVGDAFEYDIFSQAAVSSLAVARAGCGSCNTPADTQLDSLADAIAELVSNPLPLDPPIGQQNRFYAIDLFSEIGGVVRLPASGRLAAYRPIDDFAAATDPADQYAAVQSMLADGRADFFSPSFANFASCGDRKREVTDSTGVQATKSAAAGGPFAPTAYMLESSCVGFPWSAMEVPAPPSNPPATPPVMVVGSVGDTITPFPWAEALAQETLGGVFVKASYDGHARAMEKTSTCLDDLLMATLMDAKAPPQGQTCGQDPMGGAPCDPAMPECAPGFWCGLGDTAAVPGSDACTPLGPGMDGDACSLPGNACGEDLTCQDFGNATNDRTCHVVCSVDADCTGFCTPVGTSSRGACTIECDPFNDTCMGGLACKRVRPRIEGGFGLTCAEVGTKPIGDPCNGADECVAGAVCQDSTCRDLCSTTEACSTGTCTPFTGAPGGLGYCLP